jgi:hypothetical protein
VPAPSSLASEAGLDQARYQGKEGRHEGRGLSVPGQDQDRGTRTAAQRQEGKSQASKKFPPASHRGSYSCSFSVRAIFKDLRFLQNMMRQGIDF